MRGSCHVEVAIVRIGFRLEKGVGLDPAGCADDPAVNVGQRDRHEEAEGCVGGLLVCQVALRLAHRHEENCDCPVGGSGNSQAGVQLPQGHVFVDILSIGVGETLLVHPAPGHPAAEHAASEEAEHLATSPTRTAEPGDGVREQIHVDADPAVHEAEPAQEEGDERLHEVLEVVLDDWRRNDEHQAVPDDPLRLADRQQEGHDAAVDEPLPRVLFDDVAEAVDDRGCVGDLLVDSGDATAEVLHAVRAVHVGTVQHVDCREKRHDLDLARIDEGACCDHDSCGIVSDRDGGQRSRHQRQDLLHALAILSRDEVRGANAEGDVSCDGGESQVEHAGQGVGDPQRDEHTAEDHEGDADPSLLQLLD